MSILLNERCIACRRDSPRVTDAKLRELKPWVPDWDRWNARPFSGWSAFFDSGTLPRPYRLQSRGFLAEAVAHRPAILTESRQVTVTLWTHEIRASIGDDFMMAAKLDSLTLSPWRR